MNQMIFMTGGTGYLGRPLAERLLAKGQSVRLLVRPGSERKAPSGADVVVGDPMNPRSFQDEIPSGGVFVQLLGTPKPAPWKGKEFEQVDGRSALASIQAACTAGVRRFVYVSVAHPAPVMKSYIRVRSQCERALVESGLTYTILRPWYVLGTGHWWPYSLLPFYWIAKSIPSARGNALRLGLVTHPQMVAALEWAVLAKDSANQVLDVPAIRRVAAGDSV